MAIKRALSHSESIDTRLAAAAALDRLGKLDEPIDAVLAREIRNVDGESTRALLPNEVGPLSCPRPPVRPRTLVDNLRVSPLPA